MTGITPACRAPGSSSDASLRNTLSAVVESYLSITKTPYTPGTDTVEIKAASGKVENTFVHEASVEYKAKNVNITYTVVDSEGKTITSGTLTLDGAGLTNLEWATVTEWTTNPTAGEAKEDNNLATGVTISGSGSQEYYVVIWINETAAAQDDSGSFTGTVSFNAADGSGVTSTFTA